MDVGVVEFPPGIVLELLRVSPLEGGPSHDAWRLAWGEVGNPDDPAPYSGEIFLTIPAMKTLVANFHAIEERHDL